LKKPTKWKKIKRQDQQKEQERTPHHNMTQIGKWQHKKMEKQGG